MKGSKVLVGRKLDYENKHKFDLVLKADDGNYECTSAVKVCIGLRNRIASLGYGDTR